MNNILPISGRARVNIALISVILIITFLVIISDFMVLNLVKAYFNGETIDVADAKAIESRQHLINTCYVIASILSSIAFLVWLHRAYHNMMQRVDAPLFSPGWAVGVWFIPFINLVRPYNVMREIFSESQQIIDNHKKSSNPILKFPLIGWWWGIYLTRNVLLQVSSRVVKSADTMYEIRTAAIFDIIVSLIGMAAAVVTIQMIIQHSKLEEQLSAIPEEEQIVAS